MPLNPEEPTSILVKNVEACRNM